MVYAYAKQVYSKSLLVLNMQVTVEVLCSSYLTGGGSVADKNIYLQHYSSCMKVL